MSTIKIRYALKLITFLFCFIAINISYAETFVAGKDYEVIQPNANIPALPAKTITVTEFFSYGCPWCFALEPEIQKWLKNKPNYVTFTRIPVVFEAGWEYYAKAYYIAQALHIDKKITPSLFDAIQKQHLNLNHGNTMKQFLIKNGVQENMAQEVSEASPTLDAEIAQGVTLMHAYQVYVVPAIVIDGKYRTDIQLSGADDKRFIKIVQYLVSLRKTEKLK